MARPAGDGGVQASGTHSSAAAGLGESGAAASRASSGSLRDGGMGAPRPTHNMTASGTEAGASTRPAVSCRERYLQLRPLSFTDLPYHIDFSPTSDATRHPDTSHFLRQIINEAIAWDASQWRKTGTHRFTSRKSPAYGIAVEQLAKQIGQETWFARSSTHLEKDSFGWKAFDDILRREHSVHEAKYTPNIFDSNEVLAWDGEELDSFARESGLGVREVGMSVHNIYHSTPFPLQDRVFTVLVLTCLHTTSASSEHHSDNESIIVQIPVDLSDFPSHMKARCHHTFSSTNTGTVYQPPNEVNHPKAGQKLFPARYASVEKVTQGREKAEGGEEVRWVMSTTSDFGGVVPKWVQDMAVPGEIVKDVEFVLGYLKERVVGE